MGKIDLLIICEGIGIKIYTYFIESIGKATNELLDFMRRFSNWIQINTQVCWQSR